MSYFSFVQDDIIRNTLVAYPRMEFYVYQREVFFNNEHHLSGAFTGSVPNAQHKANSSGHVSLFEYNVDRTDQSTSIPGGTGLIIPYIVKSGDFVGVKSVTDQDWVSEFDVGDVVYGRYPLSASITKKMLIPNFKDHAITGSALKNTLNHYTYLSPHYLYSNTGKWDKDSQTLNLISIPSIFYGSSIKKGTVELNFFISGTLAGQLKDINKNGELIQVTGAANALGADYGSGAVAGVVLYNEGFIILTGSWDLDPVFKEPYTPSSAGNVSPTWYRFGVGMNELAADSDNNTPSSSFGIKFSGSTETQVMTMFAHAPRGLLNHSNNPTYLQYSQSLDPLTGSHFYAEQSKLQIKNIVSGNFVDLSEDFKKQTYISKIKLYDDKMNCIGIAKVATPIKKTANRDLTFKLKLDI